MSEENKLAKPKLKLALSKNIDLTKNNSLSILLDIKNKVEEKKQEKIKQLKVAKDKNNNSAVKLAVLANAGQKPSAVANKDKTQNSANANKNTKQSDKSEVKGNKISESKPLKVSGNKSAINSTSTDNNINSKGDNKVEQAKLATTEDNKKSSQETKNKLNRYSFKNILKKLHEIYPDSFPEEDEIVALKIGIKEDIKSNKELMNMLKLSNNYLGEFLRWYTSSKNYRQNALLPEAFRYDLAGEVTGKVTQMQADKAKKKLDTKQTDKEASSLQVADNDKSNE